VRRSTRMPNLNLATIYPLLVSEWYALQIRYFSLIDHRNG
jgi:hypothetical protein